MVGLLTTKRKRADGISGGRIPLECPPVCPECYRKLDDGDVVACYYVATIEEWSDVFVFCRDHQVDVPLGSCTSPEGVLHGTLRERTVPATGAREYELDAVDAIILTDE